MQKFIFVTGMEDDLGTKCMASCATLALLSSRGFSLHIKKLSPLLNVHFALTDPALCGEVFVTADGAEADGDIGMMERFSQTPADMFSFTTLGILLKNVINKESFGSFVGAPVGFSPQLTDEILSFVTKTADKQPDITLCLVGGNTCDMETAPFSEAINIMKKTMPAGSVLHIHVKTEDKIPSHISPDITMAPNNCGEHNTQIPTADFSVDFDNPCAMALALEKQGLAAKIIKKLGIADFKPNLSAWRELAEKLQSPKAEVKIAICAKYMPNKKAYMSLCDALYYGGASKGIKVIPEFVATEDITEKNVCELFADCGGIVIADGKKEQGTEGMALTVRYAAENDVACLAIGQGMHVAAMELAASLAGLKGASSAEFSTTAPYLMAVRGSEFALGTCKCRTIRNTSFYTAYGKESFSERVRSGYVLNNAYRAKLSENGVYFVATSADGKACMAFVMPDKKWFTAVQFLPELTASPLKPHPLIVSFAEAASGLSI